MEKTNIPHLPTEIKLHIFSFLDAKNLLKVSQVCKQWQQISEDDYLWKPITIKKFKVIKKYNRTWKGAYLEYARLKFQLKPKPLPQEEKTQSAALFAIKRLLKIMAAFYLVFSSYRISTGRYQRSNQFVSEDLVVLIALIHTIWKRIEGRF